MTKAKRVVKVPERSRTKPAGERLSRVVQLRFTDDDYRKLEGMAAAAEMPVGSLVRLVVKRYLVDPPKHVSDTTVVMAHPAERRAE